MNTAVLAAPPAAGEPELREGERRHPADDRGSLLLVLGQDLLEPGLELGRGRAAYRYVPATNAGERQTTQSWPMILSAGVEVLAENTLLASSPLEDPLHLEPDEDLRVVSGHLHRAAPGPRPRRRPRR